MVKKNLSFLAAAGTFVALIGLLKALVWLVPQVHTSFIQSSAISHFEIYAVIILTGATVFNFKNNKISRELYRDELEQQVKKLKKEIYDTKQETIQECTKLIDERVNMIQLKLDHNTATLLELKESHKTLSNQIVEDLLAKLRNRITPNEA